MISLPAIRYVPSSSKSAIGFIYLQCHVKPGASKQRQGIISISHSVIEICVAAQAREGEANKSVKDVFSSVLKCPKFEVEVVQGLKSRDKTIAISVDVKGDEQQAVSGVREKVEDAVV